MFESYITASQVLVNGDAFYSDYLFMTGVFEIVILSRNEYSGVWFTDHVSARKWGWGLWVSWCGQREILQFDQPSSVRHGNNSSLSEMLLFWGWGWCRCIYWCPQLEQSRATMDVSPKQWRLIAVHTALLRVCNIDADNMLPYAGEGFIYRSKRIVCRLEVVSSI
jgi:hypothetical protein